jgi:hypothetical protein
VSKQHRYQQRHHAKGLCVCCPSKLNLFKWRCDPCQSKFTVAQRRKTGSKAWRKGHRGRPPRKAHK